MYKIAISGKAGSGKDTLSDIIYHQFYTQTHTCACGHPFFSRKNIAFADPIKEMILLMFPQVKKEYLFGSSKLRNEPIPGAFKNGQPLTIRQLLQDLGESCKQYNPRIWVDAFDHTYKQAAQENISMVIASDLRFIDEFSYLKENGFYLIRLLREEVTHMNHISETQQSQIRNEDFDKVIYNNSSIEDLGLQVEEIVKMVKS